MAYLETHPWLAFALNLKTLPYKGWLLLGECACRCEHMAGAPLRPATAAHMHKVYLAKGVMATTAIEGNTLSEKEVMDRIEGKGNVPPSKQYLAQEVDNIIKECNLILERATTNSLEKITPERLCDINRIVLEKLDLPEEIKPGRYRAHRVTVGKYRAPLPQDVPALARKLCAFLEEFDATPGLPAMAVGILKSALAHLYIAWIHPFGDGNGRTARLVEYELLLQCGIPSVSAHLLSNHYNQTRTEYYRHLDESSRSANPISFILYALQGFVDGLEQQSDVIRQEQLDIAWRNYVHESFKTHKTNVGNRRRHLVLDISRNEQGVTLEEIQSLTPRLAQWYARKTTKTLVRDLNAVIKMDLVQKKGKTYRAKRELILAFLPLRIQCRASVSK